MAANNGLRRIDVARARIIPCCVVKTGMMGESQRRHGHRSPTSYPSTSRCDARAGGRKAFEGENLVLEHRLAEGKFERIDEIPTELVGLPRRAALCFSRRTIKPGAATGASP